MIKNNFTFRAMQTADLSAVLLIEQEQEFPWTPGMLQDCLMAKYECWVMENSQEIIGFSVLMTGTEQAELLNIVIKKNYQRQGYGCELLLHMLAIAKAKKAKDVILEVRVSNKAALALYEKMGFQKIGVREKYYAALTNREDAFVLKVKI